MKMYTMSDGIELIAETEHEKEILNLFNIKGVRVTAYDVTNHKMIIETKLERPVFIENDLCLLM